MNEGRRCEIPYLPGSLLRFVSHGLIILHPSQVVKAMHEAERYKGVSLLVNYATCVMQGIEGGMCNGIGDAKMATETGYW